MLASAAGTGAAAAAVHLLQLGQLLPPLPRLRRRRRLLPVAYGGVLSSSGRAAAGARRAPLVDVDGECQRARVVVGVLLGRPAARAARRLFLVRLRVRRRRRRGHARIGDDGVVPRAGRRQSGGGGSYPVGPHGGHEPHTYGTGATPAGARCTGSSAAARRRRVAVVGGARPPPSPLAAAPAAPCPSAPPRPPS